MRRLHYAFLIAIAATPAQAAPPLITEDTGTQGKGAYQLEVTVEQARESRSGASYDARETSVVLDYGVAEDIDVQFVVPYLRLTEDGAAGRTVTNGVLDTFINLKWRFYEHDTLSFAFVPGVILPTGAAGLSSERVNLRTLLIASVEPGALGLHAQAGYRYFANVQGLREHLYQLSGAATYTLYDKFKLVADYSVETNPDPAVSGTMRFATLGVIWKFAPGYGLGCGVKQGHGGSAIEHTYICGIGMRR
jgi:hypothetical protein